MAKNATIERAEGEWTSKVRPHKLKVVSPEAPSTPPKPQYSAARRATRGLTMKQEKFCQAYVATGSASQAYRHAYDTSGCKPASVNRKAFELLENVKITARVAKLQSLIAERAAITVESLVADLSKAMEIAADTRQAGAYVQAVMAKAKLLGLVTDKSEVKSTQFVVEAPAVEPTTEAWLDSLAVKEAS